MQKYNFIQNTPKILKFSRLSALQVRNYTQPLYFQSKINKRPSQCTISLVRFAQTDAFKCWNCGTDRKLSTDLFCPKCNVVQQPSNTENYFKVLSVGEDFNIDQKSLTTKYRKLQAVLHPDKFSNKSDKEKDISADYSSLVNKAYNTLQIPLKRAIHMLNLRGEKIEEDLKVTDPELLMEIMELNEQVEAANTPDQLRKLNENNKNVLEQIGQEISNYLRENQIEKAKASVIKMKYYNSVNLHINGLLRERGIVD